MSIIDKFMLTGKKAVVTGGARGIGQSIAIAFAEAGADVVVFDLLDGSETVAKVKALGHDSFSIVIDVTDEKAVDEAFAEVVKRFSTVDVVFNNAGICIDKKAEEMTLQEWNKVIDVDLTSQFLVARAAGRIMIKSGKGGSIVNTASMSGHIVNFPQEQCAYNAAKAGVMHLTKSLAMEWAKYNIRVNSISPGYVGSPMSINAPIEWQKIWFSQSPQKRMCDPDELQGAVLYFASNASTFTTGADLLVDGGFTVV
jgi:sorbose reductase